MKTTELMIGDWVISNKRGKNEIVKVVSFDGGINCCWIGADCFLGLVACEDLSPISLTPEILEKNGWKHDGIFMDKRIDENTCFSWPDRLGAVLYRNNYHMCDCKYVHTLQHALRLCELDELADNFKI